MDTRGTVIVVLLLLLSATPDGHGHGVSANRKESKKFQLPHKIRVRVYNNLGDGMNVTVHCQSKDNDLGIHVLYNGGSFQWKFRTNFMANTLFFCSVRWEQNRLTFNSFEQLRDLARCKRCVWKVSPDGVRGYNGENRDEQIWFRWNTKPSPPGDS